MFEEQIIINSNSLREINIFLQQSNELRERKMAIVIPVANFVLLGGYRGKEGFSGMEEFTYLTSSNELEQNRMIFGDGEYITLPVL